MSSTRNRNMFGDYCLEQKSNHKNNAYNLYKKKAYAHKTMLPCSGINVGHMPNKVLSSNSTEIENALFGIGSTNLVNPKPNTIPDINHLDYVSFFDRPTVFLPEPLVIEKGQRPNIFRR